MKAETSATKANHENDPAPMAGINEKKGHYTLFKGCALLLINEPHIENIKHIKNKNILQRWQWEKWLDNKDGAYNDCSVLDTYVASQISVLEKKSGRCSKNSRIMEETKQITAKTQAITK